MQSTANIHVLPPLSGENPERLENTNIEEAINLSPSTRYYGSKRKLLNWIHQHVQPLEFETVLDGFGGTASVSRLFKLMGKKVFYNDALLFNRFGAECILSDSIAIEPDRFLKIVNKIVPKTGLIAETFEGLYFTNRENEWLDGLASTVFSGKFSKSEKALLLYTACQACLKKRPFNLFHRANLSLRTRPNIKRKFGNTTTWERSFEELMIQCYFELRASLKQGQRDPQILEPQNISNIEPGYDLVYLDPPYIHLEEKNNNDDYWKKYHFLEGFCSYETWQDKIRNQTPTKMIDRPKHFSDWGKKANFKENLFHLIEKHKNSKIVLSYLTNSFPDEEEISDYLRQVFTDVKIHKMKHNHALSKSQKEEIIFIGV